LEGNIRFTTEPSKNMIWGLGEMETRVAGGGERAEKWYFKPKGGKAGSPSKNLE